MNKKVRGTRQAVVFVVVLYLVGGIGFANTIVAWGGQSTSALTNVPVDLTNVVAFSAGATHNLVLLANGTVAAWGRNDAGQTNVPPGLSNVVAVAAGGAHGLALKCDGTIAGWGSNSSGQANIPVGATNVVAISAGGDHNLALKRDGSIVAWGSNLYGQTNVPTSATNVVAIAAGGAHSAVLRRDGTVVCWGLNNYGQVTNAPTSLTNVVAVSAGGLHTLALLDDGTLKYWGVVTGGSTKGSNAPACLSNVVAISAGGNHSLAILADATICGGGIPYSGVTNLPTGLSNVVAASAAQGSVRVLAPQITSVAGTHSLAMFGDGHIHVDAPFVAREVPVRSFLLLNAMATGPLPLQYQWLHNGTNLPAATNALLALAENSRRHSGVYAVVVSNQTESVTNEIAFVKVRVPQVLSAPILDGAGRPTFLSGDVDGSMLQPDDLPNFEVQASGDLNTWETLASPTVITNGLMLIKDPTSNPTTSRFYRMLER